MQRPNILLITTDQQRCDSIGAYGAPWAKTPAMDRLAAEGVRFDRAYCANPVCTPSRVSLLTGLSMHRHGVWNVGCNAPEHLPFVTDALRGAGYRTASVGKLHLQAHHGAGSLESDVGLGVEPRFSKTPYYGFEEVELSINHGHWRLPYGQYGDWLRERVGESELERMNTVRPVVGERFNAAGLDWDLPSELHQGAWAAERAGAMLDRFAEASEPFFLHVGLADPHHPHTVPTDWDDRADPAAIPPPVGRSGELDDLPPHFKTTYESGVKDAPFAGEYGVAGQGRHDGYAGLSRDAIRTSRAYYHTMVRQMDAHVGRILDHLRRTGLERDTLVVFTSDHGELLGDHGLWLKGPYHFEPLVRVPLLLRWPEGLPVGAAAGEIASLVDVAPTLLAAAGADVPENLDGINLLPALRGGAPWPRDHAVVECCDDPKGLRPRTVVTRDAKLTLYPESDDGESFDLAEDPDELRNLWSDPSQASRIDALRARLAACPPEVEHPVERVGMA